MVECNLDSCSNEWIIKAYNVLIQVIIIHPTSVKWSPAIIMGITGRDKFTCIIGRKSLPVEIDPLWKTWLLKIIKSKCKLYQVKIWDPFLTPLISIASKICTNLKITTLLEKFKNKFSNSRRNGM